MKFQTVGECMGYTYKLQKHISEGNQYRIKDYILGAFLECNPMRQFDHPCWDIIKKGAKYLKNNGWTVKAVEVRGRWQLGLISPKGEYYHSYYKDTKNK